MMDRPLPPWKGLDPDRKPVFLGYDQTERMLAALLDRAAVWKPDLVVGIARGGVVPATMAATILALPLATIAYDRAAARGDWIGPPPKACACCWSTMAAAPAARCGRCATGCWPTAAPA